MYIPSEKQIEAHTATERFLGYGGAMGGGKSRFLCEVALQFSINFPNNFGVIARQSGPALRLTTMEVFFTETLVPHSKEWKRLGANFNKAEGILTFNSVDPPSKIWFTGLDHDNLERIKSLNLGFFCIDEATEVAESTYMMRITRLRRAGIPAIFRKGIVSANPEAGWVKRRFVDQKLKDHKFVQANYTDNPHLPDDYPSLFDTMPMHWRQKYLDGNWGAVTGLIYKEFIPDRHKIPWQPLPPEWYRFRGFDHGQQNPSCCLAFGYGYKDFHLRDLIGEDRYKAMDSRYDDYPVIIADKMYYSPGLVSKHRESIHKRWPDWVGPTYADPSIWKKDREKMLSDGRRVEYSIADEYLEQPYPLIGLTRGNNIVQVGINRVSQLLEIGHLYFMDHPSLEELIGDAGEIRSYSWKQPRTDDDDWPEEPIKRRDHGCDAMRYAVMSLPPLKVEKGTVIPYNSFMAARQRAHKYRSGKKQLRIHGGKVIG